MFLSNAIGYCFIKFMKQVAFWKIDNLLKLNLNVTLLSLNNISEFEKKRKHFYSDEQLYSTNLDAGL